MGAMEWGMGGLERQEPGLTRPCHKCTSEVSAGKLLPGGPWNGVGQRRTSDAVLLKMLQSTKVAVASKKYTPPPCEHEGHFLETASMGAME